VHWLRRGRHHYVSVIRRGEGLRSLAILLAVLGATAAVLFIVGRVDTARRSGTAAIQIVSIRFQYGDHYAQSPAGSNIQYQYVVNGVTYPGADFRTWTDVLAHDPKVCFDPSDPRNHLLVNGPIRCGIDAGP
jgi:hypothetical protein